MPAEPGARTETSTDRLTWPRVVIWAVVSVVLVLGMAYVSVFAWLAFTTIRQALDAYAYFTGWLRAYFLVGSLVTGYALVRLGGIARTRLRAAAAEHADLISKLAVMSFEALPMLLFVTFAAPFVLVLWPLALLVFKIRKGARARALAAADARQVHELQDAIGSERDAPPERPHAGAI